MIRYQYGLPLVGKLAKLAGQKQAEREEYQRQQEEARQIRQMQFQRDMANFQANLDIQAAQRARVWELEKAEIQSRYNFTEDLKKESLLKERDLRKRIEAEDNYERAMKKWIEEYGDPKTATGYLKDVFNNWHAQLIAQTYGFKATLPSPQRPLTWQQVMGQYAQQYMPQTMPMTFPPTVPETSQTSKIRVKNPQGVTGTINLTEWPQAKAEGWTRLE